MSAPELRPGAVFVVRFPEHRPAGHEQEGLRPAVVVGLPTGAGTPRFPVLLMAPLTTFREQDWVAAAPELYPVLASGAGGLPHASVVLADQIRAVDVGRVARFLGNLDGSQYAPVQQVLYRMFGLNA